MEKRNKVALASAIVAALATSAVVAGMAFGAPKPSTPTATSMGVQAAAEAHESGAVTTVDTDNVQDENGADGATEVKGAEGAEETASATTETDGVDHQFEGQETGDNGNGVQDAADATEAQ